MKITRAQLTNDLEQFIILSNQLAIEYTGKPESDDIILEQYIDSLDNAMKVCEKYNNDFFQQMCVDGTIGNEAKIFAEAFKYVK